MKNLILYIAHKRLELLFLGVLAVVLYEVHLPLPTALLLLTVVGSYFLAREIQIVRDLPIYMVALVRRYLIEIAVLCVLALIESIVSLNIVAVCAVLLIYAGAVAGVNSRSVQLALQRGVADVMHDAAALTCVVILFGLLLILHVQLAPLFFILAFAMFLLYQWDSRILGGVALLAFAFCPIFLLAGEAMVAQQMAVYAFYLLLMTVALQVLEHIAQQEAVASRQESIHKGVLVQ